MTAHKPSGTHSSRDWRHREPPAWLTGTPTGFRPDQIDFWLTRRSEHHDRLDLAIHRHDDNQYVGELALTDLDPANEAMRTILTHAFHTVGIHRVHLDVYAFNTRAARTYERLGFADEGRARQALLWDGERHDALLMSMLRPEWEATNHDE